MKVLLEIDHPVQGHYYESKVKNKKLTFQLVQVEEEKGIAEEHKEDEFPGFGCMPWLKGFDEKEAQKAKKAIRKEIKL